MASANITTFDALKGKLLRIQPQSVLDRMMLMANIAPSERPSKELPTHGHRVEALLNYLISNNKLEGFIKANTGELHIADPAVVSAIVQEAQATAQPKAPDVSLRIQAQGLVDLMDQTRAAGEDPVSAVAIRLNVLMLEAQKKARNPLNRDS